MTMTSADDKTEKIYMQKMKTLTRHLFLEAHVMAKGAPRNRHLYPERPHGYQTEIPSNTEIFGE